MYNMLSPTWVAQKKGCPSYASEHLLELLSMKQAKVRPVSGTSTLVCLWFPRSRTAATFYIRR